MSFIAIRVRCDTVLIDFLISEFFQIGFDSFQEFEDGFEASCEKEKFQESKVRSILIPFPEVYYIIKEEERINWNEEWEKNYDPITIEDKCIIRASFHKPQPSFEYEIIITPKMSFGTGHHDTTYQMLSYQMQLDHRSKKVLDVGTGTGILAIMASKRGASRIFATDIDDWCIENSTENFGLNQVAIDFFHKGQIADLEEKGFDIITANINRNVLIAQIPTYSEKLLPEGKLLLSGFYEEDIESLVSVGNDHQLKKIAFTTKDNWAMLVLSKELI